VANNKRKREIQAGKGIDYLMNKWIDIKKELPPGVFTRPSSKKKGGFFIKNKLTDVKSEKVIEFIHGEISKDKN